MRYHRDAPHERDGGVVRAPDEVGARTRVRRFSAGHGAALGLRGFAGGLALEPARRVPVRARRRRSTTFRDCARTRRSSIRAGSRTTSRTRAACACRASWPTSRRSSPAATGRSSGSDPAAKRATDTVLGGSVRRPEAWQERVHARLTEMVGRGGEEVVVRIAVERSDDRSVIARTEQLTVQDHALDSRARHRT